MRYADNTIGGIVNGVIFYFEEGDEVIAIDIFEVVEASEKPPTSVAWNGECMSAADALIRLQTDGLLEDEWLGLRLTIDDSDLLKACLELFKEYYPALAQMTEGIDDQVFGTPN